MTTSGRSSTSELTRKTQIRSWLSFLCFMRCRSGAPAWLGTEPTYHNRPVSLLPTRCCMIRILIGNIFESRPQTLVNTVNTVGMGKGVALGFRERFPEMYEDYVRRCQRRELRLGRPYFYRRSAPPNVINFPTKDHWRSVSKLNDITEGLAYLEAHLAEWDVTSLAVPPLGCGEGRLEWRVVGPTLYRHLAHLGIPVELYAPFGTPHEELQPEFLGQQIPVSSSNSHQEESSAPVSRAAWLDCAGCDHRAG